MQRAQRHVMRTRVVLCTAVGLTRGSIDKQSESSSSKYFASFHNHRLAFHFHSQIRSTTAFSKNQQSDFVRAFSNCSSRMGVHNLATKAEFTSALKDNQIVILDAFATWCGPCKAIAPQVAKFSEQYPSAHFVKIDVDEVPDVAQELGIRAMPTFLIFKGGDKIAEVVGANPKALQAAIEQATGEAKA